MIWTVARALLGQPALQFVDTPAFSPPENAFTFDADAWARSSGSSRHFDAVIDVVSRFSQGDCPYHQHPARRSLNGTPERVSGSAFAR
jgi:hypothetical protein